MRLAALILTAVLLPLAAQGSDRAHTHGQSDSHGHGAHNAHASGPYAGSQSRRIKGLSDSDIAQIEAGQGWGLALPAELNGKPGPAHLLELQDQLDLTADQIARIEALHQQMQAEAIAAGKDFIAAEQALSDAFAG